MRCIVKDYKNHEHEGKFIGSLCFPCYAYITTGRGEYSQAFRNAQRTWVGLTDEEISELIRATHNTGSFVRAIEAKLKEKNT
jgi:hypothetical protein